MRELQMINSDELKSISKDRTMRKLNSLFLVILAVLFATDFATAEDANGGNNVQQGDDAVQADQGDGAVQAGDDQYNQVEEGEEIEGEEGQAADEVDDYYAGAGYYQNFEGNNGNAQSNDDYWVNNANKDYSYNDNEQETEDDAYYQSKVQVCSDAVIQVQDVVLYCDSPGTYYYGSGKYRNSQTCLPGDKARVIIDFYIADQSTIYKAGNKALLDIYAQSGTYTKDVTVYEGTDLCSLSSLKRKGRSQCPYNGYYQIKTHFYWGDSNGGDGANFVPTIVVGFKSSVQKNVYDFGGANTNLCRGSTFLTWSQGVRVSYANAMNNFLMTFGLLILTIAFLGGLAFVLLKRPRSFSEAKAQIVETKRNFVRRRQRRRELSIQEDDEEFDFRKIQTAGNRDLMDF